MTHPETPAPSEKSPDTTFTDPLEGLEPGTASASEMTDEEFTQQANAAFSGEEPASPPPPPPSNDAEMSRIATARRLIGEVAISPGRAANLNSEKAHRKAIREDEEIHNPSLMKDVGAAESQAYEAGEKLLYPDRVVDLGKAETQAHREQKKILKAEAAEKYAGLEKDQDVAREMADAETKVRNFDTERAREQRNFPQRVADVEQARAQAFRAHTEAADLTNLQRQYSERRRAIEAQTVNGKLKQEMLGHLATQEKAVFAKVRSNYEKYKKQEVESTLKIAEAAAKGLNLVSTLTSKDEDASARAGLRRKALGITDGQDTMDVRRYGGILRTKRYRGPRLEERTFSVPGMPTGRLIEVVRISTGELVRQTLVTGDERSINQTKTALRRSDLGIKRNGAARQIGGSASELATMGSWDEQRGKKRKSSRLITWLLNLRQE